MDAPHPLERNLIIMASLFAAILVPTGSTPDEIQELADEALRDHSSRFPGWSVGGMFRGTWQPTEWQAQRATEPCRICQPAPYKGCIGCGGPGTRPLPVGAQPTDILPVAEFLADPHLIRPAVVIFSGRVMSASPDYPNDCSYAQAEKWPGNLHRALARHSDASLAILSLNIDA